MGAVICDVREEIGADVEGVRAVNRAAFGRHDEAELVDGLRQNGRAVVSVVAHSAGIVAGHLLLSTAAIVDGDHVEPCLTLAPMAVAPDRQRQGIGTQLVQRALKLARQRGHRVVTVLGHPDYYPRFGFEPAAPRGVSCPYDVPDDTFMILALQPGALDGLSGVVEYPPEFATL